MENLPRIIEKTKKHSRLLYNGKPHDLTFYINLKKYYVLSKTKIFTNVNTGIYNNINLQENKTITFLKTFPYFTKFLYFTLK